MCVMVWLGEDAASMPHTLDDHVEAYQFHCYSLLRSFDFVLKQSSKHSNQTIFSTRQINSVAE